MAKKQRSLRNVDARGIRPTPVRPTGDAALPPEPRAKRLRPRPLLPRLFEPVDIASLVVFRICFGAIMCCEVYRYLYSGWIGFNWVGPKYNFTFFGFDWVRPWPGEGMYLHFMALGVLGFCIAIGLCYRLATILFVPAFAYVLLLEKSNYLNHFYLITLIGFLLIFIPAHRSFSVDAWLRPKIRSNTTPAWTVWALVLQISIPYFFGGIAKLKWDWLILGEPMRGFLASAAANFPVVGLLFDKEPLVYFLAWSGMLFDLSIPFLLWWPKTRNRAFIAALAFHLFNARLFSIGIFPWFMICASTLFFSPSWPRKFGFPPGRNSPVADLRRTSGTGAGASAESGGGKQSWLGGYGLGGLAAPVGERIAVGVLAVHFVFQLLMPFSHYLYPGDVNWTREGGYFTWHMRMARLSASGTITATDPATNESWQVDPRQHLNHRQIRNMMTDPDMLVQYAHFLARRAAAAGKPNIEVRAKVRCALNGREPRMRIDPNVNLALLQRSILPASFVTPFEEAPLSGKDFAAAAASLSPDEGPEE